MYLQHSLQILLYSILYFHTARCLYPPAVRKFIEMYQKQQDKPCTIVGLGLNHKLHTFKEDENDPLFQHIFWKIELGLDVKKFLMPDTRNLLFNTGCTIYIVPSLYVKAIPQFFKVIILLLVSVRDQILIFGTSILQI